MVYAGDLRFWEVEHGWHIASGTFAGVGTGQKAVRRVAANEGPEVADSASALGSRGRVGGFEGLNRTARALKLDYYTLKERVEAAPKNRKTNTSAFLELPQVALPSKECVIELGDGEGLVRIRLTGYEACEIVAVGCGLREA